MSGKHFKTKKENKKNRYEQKNKKNRTLLNKIILTLSIVVFLVCLIIIIYWLYSTIELEKIEQNLSSFVTEIEENKETENTPDTTIEQASLKIDFEQLKSINQDVVGWIYIKDTDINYPILQTTDNEYYLKKSIYKTYSSCGSIFLDYNTKSDFSEQNSVIYGHNLKNQKMFADLAKVYRGELGNKIDIEIYTEQSFKKYSIFACYMEEPNINVIQKNWNQEQKNNFIDTAIQKSNIEFTSDIDYNKNIVTLITCDSTGKKRIIVHAI